MAFIQENDIILFQGDSITDCSRNKLKRSDLGQGYVNLIYHYLQTHHQDLHITCINKGIYGNRTIDLKLRWRLDTLRIEKNILSLLAGINDTWRRYDFNLTTSPEKFEEHYRYLLDTSLDKNPDLRIILLSPFLLPHTESQLTWFEDLNPKIQIVEKLAKEYNTLYLPLQEIFTSSLTPEHDAYYFTVDGVHPTPEGHMLIAKEWLKRSLG
ncbi:SGNH/GDSL hydrolase family protein [Niameybacter massiliensis]|uniref:SGNH/GDSL hydrolase family protein n=1 Tax=Niameybacter massiliensis TaxID=1658108 RepID=UPI0006B4EAA1|nr:SGNH/GDSL hydrolase family protein [Niameybacter massiliensis]